MGDSSDSKRKREVTDCPYLDTIQRSLLDFDFEPCCSVSLQTGPHVYGCLVCGKYFRGKSPSSPAHTHSVEESHFIFVHLDKGTFHCLPDDYEINDPSLADIATALHPTFTQEQVKAIDSNTDLSRDLFGKQYLPGFVGLNNLNKTDCINSVVQALAHVPPLRDFFLLKKHNETLLRGTKATSATHRLAHQVTQAFGELVRKMWSGQRFKAHVDPHVLIQAVSVASKKKFRVGQQAEAGEFMAWLLNQLHLGTGGSKKPGSSIIFKTFQGNLTVTTRQAKKKEEPKTVVDDRGGSDTEEEEEQVTANEENKGEQVVVEETTADSHFLQLTLDLSEKPLFRDEDGGLVIPQEPLFTVLKKFDGLSFSDAITRSGAVQRKRYRLRKLPDYLVVHLARFKTTQYSREKNPTIVAFPVKNLDLSEYVYHEEERPLPPSENEIRAMSVSGTYIKAGCLRSASHRLSLLSQ